MAKKSREIRCSVCGKGILRQRFVTHDVGDLLGLKEVVIKDAPALVCSKCGEVTIDGRLLEEVSFIIAASIISQSVLDPMEVRYLRNLLGDRQQDLADKLGVTRATVNRWEMGKEPVSGPNAYALRSHAFFRLRSRSKAVEGAAPAFEGRPAKRKKLPSTLDGRRLMAAAGW
jgi:YgiT-type zinc finger domain-containing protein